MLDAEAMPCLTVMRIDVGAEIFESRFEGVDCKSVGEISDRINIDLITLVCPIKC